MPPFLQKLFRKKSAVPVAPVVPAPATSDSRPAVAKTNGESAMPVPQVAVARLSLLPILQKLPEDLRQNIVKYPEGEATVALPLATIQKQLAAGSVKMSLASLYRQSPSGTFSQVRVEEKRMIEVPLSEVLRHVQPEALRRRADQRRLDLPSSAPQLFGDRANPFAIAPTTGDEFPVPDLEPKFTLDDDEPANGFHHEEPAPLKMPPLGAPLRMPMATAPKVDLPAAPEPAVTDTGIVSIPVSQVYEGWPEPLRSEGASVPESNLQIPAILLAAALSQGRPVFRWSQVRPWFTPPLLGDTDEYDATEVPLPLKVVAPAFLAHSRPRVNRQEVELDEEIPALFNAGEEAASSAAEPTLQVEASDSESRPEQAPLPPLSMGDIAPNPIPPTAQPLTFRLATPLVEEITSEAESSVTLPLPPLVLKAAPVEEVVPTTTPQVEPEMVSSPPEPTPRPEEPAQAAAVEQPHPLGTVFGRPHQQTWGPQEIIDAMVTLPGVAGAIVALREGLLVAARLPEHMKGDTVAAFLPQIFARLNNYAQEMQIGEVEDVLLTTNGAHFQGYRMGDVYFAVLGVAGEALPWEALRLVVQELQTQVSS